MVTVEQFRRRPNGIEEYCPACNKVTVVSATEKRRGTIEMECIECGFIWWYDGET